MYSLRNKNLHFWQVNKGAWTNIYDSDDRQRTLNNIEKLLRRIDIDDQSRKEEYTHSGTRIDIYDQFMKEYNRRIYSLRNKWEH